MRSAAFFTQRLLTTVVAGFAFSLSSGITPAVIAQEATGPEVTITRRQPADAVPPPACPDPATVEADLRAALVAAVRQNEALHGAWAEVIVDPDTQRFVLNLIVDGTAAAAQQLEIERIVQRYVPDKCFHVADVDVRAFSAVVTDIANAVEDHIGLGGAMITGGYYVQEANELTIALVGRVAFEDQKAPITDLANGVLQALPSRSPLKGMRVKAEELAVVAPSPPVAAQFFTAGVEHFTQRNYAAAREEFHLAIVEAPDRLDYRYWRVVAEIGMGHSDRAYTHLLPLVNFRRAEGVLVGDYVQTLYSLERVQGPIRQKLLDLEHRAFAEGPVTPPE